MIIILFAPWNGTKWALCPITEENYHGIKTLLTFFLIQRIFHRKSSCLGTTFVSHTKINGLSSISSCRPDTWIPHASSIRIKTIIIINRLVYFVIPYTMGWQFFCLHSFHHPLNFFIIQAGWVKEEISHITKRTHVYYVR